MSDGKKSEECSEFERAFVLEYRRLKGAGTQAYCNLRPDVKRESAAVMAHDLIRRPAVIAMLVEEAEKDSAALVVAKADILREWARIAFADPNELVSSHRWNCRHCYGTEHGYQWRDAREYAEACQAVIAAHEQRQLKAPSNDLLPPPVLPSLAGGFGFEPELTPHAKCPKCDGRGVLRVLIHDSTKVSESAARLYAGVKQTKDGYQVLLRDQDAALVNLAKALNVYPAAELSVKGKIETQGKIELSEADRSVLKSAILGAI